MASHEAVVETSGKGKGTCESHDNGWPCFQIGSHDNCLQAHRAGLKRRYAQCCTTSNANAVIPVMLTALAQAPEPQKALTPRWQERVEALIRWLRCIRHLSRGGELPTSVKFTPTCMTQWL